MPRLPQAFSTPQSSSTGFASAILAGLSFGAMSFLVHISSNQAPSAELVFLRALFTLTVLSPVVYRDVRRIFSRLARFLWLRSVAGSVSMLIYYWTLQHTSVGRSTALAHTAPVFVLLLSWRFFGEKISAREALVIGLAISGVIFLYAQGGSGLSFGVTAMGLSGAATAGIAYVSLRQAAAGLSPSLVVWSFSLVMLVMAVLVPSQRWVVPVGRSLLAVLGVCITGMLGQMFLTLSYVRLRASIASTLGLSSLVFGVLLESLFYRRLPAMSEAIGYSLILSGVSLLQMLHRADAQRHAGESTAVIAEKCDPALIETTFE